MKEIKPILTYYKDQQYRSRLEAKWAAFFTEMEIPFEYEPEGIVLENGHEPYLTDFYLPKHKVYAEVKHIGGNFTKALKMSFQLECEMLLLEGPPSMEPILISAPASHKTDLAKLLDSYQLYRQFPTLIEGYNKLYQLSGFHDGYLVTDKIHPFESNKCYSIWVCPGFSLSEDLNYTSDTLIYQQKVRNALCEQFGIKT